LKNIFNWIAEHDEKLLFIFLYIVVSLVLSIAVSLFWLLFAVLLHLGLELIRQSRVKTGKKTIILESLWETKSDFALVAFALWLVVYLDFIFGVAGLGVAARAGVQSSSRLGRIGVRLTNFITRFAAWQRVIRSFLLALDDLLILARIIQNSRRAKIMKKYNENNGAEDTPEPTPTIETKSDPYQSSWSQKWSFGDYFGLGMLILFITLVLTAPWITGLSYAEIRGIIAVEFNPFP
jgi:hypothetical protein